MAEERWEEIPDFPDYLISDFGRVQNAKTRTMRRVSRNNGGITKISLYEGNRLFTRSVAVLVAEAFVEGQTDIFDTVLHKDGNRHNCVASNLLWRPRWFVIKFHQQFDLPAFYEMDVAVEDPMSGRLYSTIPECCIAEGHHFNDVYRSYVHGERMPFTRQVFNLVR